MDRFHCIHNSDICRMSTINEFLSNFENFSTMFQNCPTGGILILNSPHHIVQVVARKCW